MASAKPHPADPVAVARDLLTRYRARAVRGDVALGDDAVWASMLAEIVDTAAGSLGAFAIRAARQADDLRPGDETSARHVPLSPLPLMLGAREWRGIADGVVQRAALMELLLADIYGAQRLVGNGLVPAALLNGSPHFLRPMVGLTPPGGHYLSLYAVDLVRGIEGDWRVLADHTRNPVGMGDALDNRLAMTRLAPGLQERLHVERLAPFFTDLRGGLAAACRRSDPRIAMLSAGRLSRSYAEQAHLARYLGVLLVEGEDLSTYDDKLYLRTIEGFKRVDALWRRMDARLLDPLAFDSGSRIGVAGLIDAFAAGNVALANAPGAGVLESTAYAAFLSRLSVRMTGEDLRLADVGTLWCGEPAALAELQGARDRYDLTAAFPARPRGLDDPAVLDADLAARGIDYVARQRVVASTLPVIDGDDLSPRPFTLRVFAARNARGDWSVLPGGLACIDGEALSADAVVVADRPVAPLTLLTAAADIPIRRNPGTLPSRVADNLFWLGRYLERAEQVLALVRGALGGSVDVDGGAALGPANAARIDAMLISVGATSPAQPTLGTAFADATQPSSVAALLDHARAIGAGSRERISTDVWRLLERPLPDDGPLARRADVLAERFAALAGHSAESMGRTAGWRFLDLGRRLERAVGIGRLLKMFDTPDATADEYAVLVDLAGSAISYRQRYPTGLAARAVRDLLALDTSNPRSLAFQVEAMAAHLAALPRLSDDGVAEAQQIAATGLVAALATQTADTLDSHALQGIENRLFSLSDTLGQRFFLRGGEPLRAPGLTLA